MLRIALALALVLAACGPAAETPDAGDTTPDAGEQPGGWQSACGDLKQCALTCEANTTASTVCASLPSNTTIPAPVAHFSFEGFDGSELSQTPCQGSTGVTNCGVFEGNVLPGDGVYGSGATFGKTLVMGDPRAGGQQIPPGAVQADGPRPTTFTIAAWVKPTTIGGERMVVSDGYDHAAGKGWKLSTTPEGQFNFLVAGGTTASMLAIQGGASCAGKWTHVAASFQGKSMRLYVNGVFLDNKIATMDEVVLGDPKFTIGKRSMSAVPFAPFDGELDDVTLWSGALTDAQVTQVYQTGFCRQSIQ